MGRNFLSSKRIQGGAKEGPQRRASSSGARFREAGIRGNVDARYWPGFGRFPTADPSLLPHPARSLQ